MFEDKYNNNQNKSSNKDCTVEICETGVIQIRVLCCDVVENICLERGWSYDAWVWVHVETHEEMQDKTKLHCRYGLLGQVNWIRGRLLIAFQY